MTFLCALLAGQEFDLAVRIAIDAMPIAAGVDDGTRIEVRDADSGAPVEGADVLVDLRRTADAVQALSEELHRGGATVFEINAAHLTRFARRYRTGPDGAVRVPIDRYPTVRVYKGHHSVQGRAGTVLRLERTRYVPVRVTDWRGRPAADVRIQAGKRFGRHFRAHCWAVTGRDGRCRIPLIGGPTAAEMEVQVDAVMTAPPTATFDGTAPPTEPLELQLPQMGMVRLVLYGKDERPSEQLASARLDVVGRSGRRGWTGKASRLTDDGASFGWVELGLTLKVFAKVKGLDRELRFEGKGPTIPGELTILEGRLNASSPVVNLRVLGVDGAPVAGETVHLAYVDEQWVDFSPADTDAEGRLRLVIPRTPKHLYILRRGAGKLTTYAGTARIAADRWQPAEQDAGDVRLQPEPVSARGRIVDANGEPVAGLLLETPISLRPGRSGPASYSSDRNPFRLRVRTDAQGRFELCELHPLRDRYEMSLTHADLLSPNKGLTVWMQAQEREYQLVARSRVAGRLAAGLGQLSLPLQLKHQKTGARLSVPVENGAFEHRDVPPGRYDLIVGDATTGFVVEAIDVPAGGAADDRRLQPLQWQHHYLVSRVKVVDDQGKPLHRANVWHLSHRAKTTVGSRHFTDANGVATLLTVRKNSYLRVVHPGFDTVPEIAPRAELEVAMTPIPATAFTVPALRSLPRGVTAQWTAAPAEPTTKVGLQPPKGTLENGRAVLRTTGKGKWLLTLKLTFAGHPDEQVQRRVERALDLRLTPFPFEVAARSAPIVFDFDAAESKDLRTSLAAVRKLLNQQ